MLLRLFRTLLPREDRFVQELAKHATLIASASEAFRAIMSDDGQAEQHASTISRLEVEADEITKDVITSAHRTFITPFDRSQILALVTAFDDTIDLMQETSRRMVRYGVAFTPEMMGMADCAVRAASEIRDAIPLLAAIDRNVAALTKMSIGVRRFESDADDLLERGLKRLFLGEGSPGYKLTVERVYDLVEAVVDRCEDIADVIDSIVVEQV